MHEKSYALITGASNGIGLELARLAASKGYNLILVARNETKMNRLKQEWETQYAIRIEIFPCDLSETGMAEKIAEFLALHQIVPDMLINNAGFGLFGAFDRTDGQRESDMLQVNIAALTQLTKIIYRQMLQRQSGHIMNVASVAGFMPGPLMSVYYASKAYVLSFTRALANEAKGTGVNVTALCPGPTETNFEKTANLSASKLFKSFGKLPSAKEVARFGFRSMEKGKTVAVYGTVNRLMVFFVRLLPGKTVTSMVRYVQRQETR
jgi:short-subunit dehydrogenase